MNELIASLANSDLGQAAVEQVEVFLQNVLQEPGTAIGGLVSDKINFRRFKNLAHTVVEAKRLLTDLGLTESDVPLKIIHPLLEAASVEEVPTLQELWANLLANAADPRRLITVEPVFVEMLKGLSWREVRFLDVLTRDANKIADLDFSEGGLARVYQHAGLAQHNVPAPPQSPHSLKADNILGTANGSEFYRMLGILELKGIFVRDQKVSISPIQERTPDYTFTQLGRDFVHACQQPKA